MYSLPFNEVTKTRFSNKVVASNSLYPVLKKGTLTVDEVADTYLDLSDWGKGVVWVNGHNLGRYWSIGPQQSIYVPREWLKKGNNDIVILELLNTKATLLKTIDKPILDRLHTVESKK